jgi:phage-related protein
MTAIEEDRVKLTADGVVQLFKIDLRNGSTLRLKANNTASWQSQTWEGIAIMMQGVKKSASEELSRPQLTIANKDHIFTQYVNQGVLEKSIVTRYRVLKSNFDGNINLYEQATWYIARVIGVTNANVTVELRNPIDGPTVITPARMYLPPEFPAVSLTG